MIGTKAQFRNNTTKERASLTPSGIMRINKDTTEFDKTYFINLSEKMGADQVVGRKLYLGKGYYMITTGSTTSGLLPNPYASTVSYYGFKPKFAIVNVYDGSFRWITGVPEPTDIQYCSEYSSNYSPLDGTGYMSITYKEGSGVKSSVYKFDGAKATATKGLTTSTFITHVSKLPVTK